MSVVRWPSSLLLRSETLGKGHRRVTARLRGEMWGEVPSEVRGGQQGGPIAGAGTAARVRVPRWDRLRWTRAGGVVRMERWGIYSPSDNPVNEKNEVDGESKRGGGVHYPARQIRVGGEGVTEQEGLESDDSFAMLLFILKWKGMNRRKAGRRKLRLLGCASCRVVWEPMTDPRSRHAVEVAERLADGQASAAEVERARSLAEQAYRAAWDRE